MSNTEIDSFQFTIDDIDYNNIYDEIDDTEDLTKFMHDDESYYKTVSQFLINDTTDTLRKISKGYILKEFKHNENITEKVFQYINAFCRKARELKTDQTKLKNWINGVDESKN